MRFTKHGSSCLGLLRHGYVLDMSKVESLAAPWPCISWVHHQSDKSSILYSKRHRFNQEDVTTFCSLTGDVNAIHTSQRAAQLAGFPNPIVPGMLIASLFPSIISSYFPGAIYMGQTLKFRHYVLVGEELEARVEMISKKEDENVHQEEQGTSKVVDRKFNTTVLDSKTSKILVEGVALARISKAE